MSDSPMAWQPIETAPWDERMIISLPYRSGPLITVGRYRTCAPPGWVGEGGGALLLHPTDWQPLPEPPE